MNRPIKFRAWDKELNRMYGAGFSLDSSGEVSIRWYADKQRRNYVEDIVLMQFTGLLDKNGKEIYEGDIVRAVYRESEGGGWYSDHKVFGAVYFDRNWGVKFDCRDKSQRTADTAWFSIVPHEKAGEALKKSHWSDNAHPSDYNSVEIIGNIYENPNLLG